LPLIAQTPHNPQYIEQFGTYRKSVTVLSRKETAVQRQVRRAGIGGYEPAFQAALLALCETGRDPIVYYDIGAHIGIYSMLIGTILRERGVKIYAFEPTPSTANLARILRDSNGLDYELVEKAVGRKEGSAQLFLSPKTESSNSLNADFRPGSRAVDVKVTTVDAEVRGGCPPPTIMKIDVETLEADVILGSREVIAQSKPVITCELLPRSDTRTGNQEILSMLEYYGYSFYRVGMEKRLREFSAVDALAALDADEKDWVLSPKKLGSKFYAALERWRLAISECNADANRLLDGGVWDRAILEEVWPVRS
jgi:FkbM family methyltransferase